MDTPALNRYANCWARIGGTDMEPNALNPHEFIDNMNAKTLEELAPYEGKYVAMSQDGKEFLAVGGSWDELYTEIKRLGLTRYVADYIPTREEVTGGWR